jgi:16S rRNA processing protein RimM
MGPIAEQRVLVGRVAGLYGVRGWVKIFSFTEPRENILEYSPWYLSGGDGSSECTIAEGRVHGKGLIARIDGVADRDVAANYVGAEISVERDQFGPASADEHYWVDLEGMQVETTDGQVLGTVAHLFATGANDVIVVEGDRRRLVPFVTDDVVRRVDKDARKIVVDWDPDF